MTSFFKTRIVEEPISETHNSNKMTQKGTRDTKFRHLLGETFQTNIVSVEVSIEGMVNVGDIVLHTVIPESKQYMFRFRYIVTY